MKELPGAPALPEGWFYRVTSRPYGYGEEERPTNKHLVDAARRAYGESADDTTVEGDYR